MSPVRIIGTHIRRGLNWPLQITGAYGTRQVACHHFVSELLESSLLLAVWCRFGGEDRTLAARRVASMSMHEISDEEKYWVLKSVHRIIVEKQKRLALLALQHASCSRIPRILT